VILDLILVIIVMLKLIEVVVLPCLMFSVFKKTETKIKIYYFCLLTRFL